MTRMKPHFVPIYAQIEIYALRKIRSYRRNFSVFSGPFVDHCDGIVVITKPTTPANLRTRSNQWKDLRALRNSCDGHESCANRRS